MFRNTLSLVLSVTLIFSSLVAPASAAVIGTHEHTSRSGDLAAEHSPPDRAPLLGGSRGRSPRVP